MNYSINVTRAAEKDLNSAVDYIDTILMNPQAADDLLKEAEEKIKELAVFPKKYQLVDDPVLKSWEVRSMIIKNYLAFYTVDDMAHTVNIIRFLYGKRNWSVILRQNQNETVPEKM